MRGKPELFDGMTDEARITPAGAGKTGCDMEILVVVRDHPRGCGENIFLYSKGQFVSGSPPRMRGKLTCSKTLSIRIGITPADAGKTSPLSAVGNIAEDHPRGCGENLRTKCGCISNPGSPPQVRGKRFIPFGFAEMPGITPAGAGKTPDRVRSELCQKHHPRRCGENALITGIADDAPGSPPQVRGKPGDRCVHQYRRGITPAGAGKTAERA